MSAFNVKWADFSMNVVNSFKQLRNSDYFIDVTLASDDEKIVSANKVVLAAGSKYFETILKTYLSRQRTRALVSLYCHL